MNVRLLLIAGMIALVVATAAACDSSDNSKTVDGELNLDPIVALADAANTDAAAMEQHAEAMTAAVADRPDRARWAADAETIRANARTLGFVAESAVAITRDPGAHPSNAVQIWRVYGDGANLHQLGQTLIDHADAMDAHLAVMREEAVGDPELLDVVDAFAPNVDAMKVDGQAAMDRGIELMDEARRLGDLIGEELPSGDEHNGN